MNKICRSTVGTLAGSFLAMVAHADVVFVGPSDSASNTGPFYQNYAYASALLPSGGFTSDMGNGTLYGSTVAPSALSLNTAFDFGGAHISPVVTTQPGGFFVAHNNAQLSVTNANADNGYTAQAAYGSRTTVEFFTSGALASRALFHWHVSGTESSTNVADCNPPTEFSLCAAARLDFAATTDSSKRFVDLFIDPSLNPLSEFGAGDYFYDIGGLPLDQVIQLMFWSSTFVNAAPGKLPQGGEFSLFADYSSTFDLIEIDLFDVNDNEITQWTMVDRATGQTVFNQDGRIAATIPEPSSITLLAAGIFGLVAGRRRISKYYVQATLNQRGMS